MQKNLHGLTDIQGTCVLLEVQTINDLKQYFQVLHQNSTSQFELKGVYINKSGVFNSDTTSNNDDNYQPYTTTTECNTHTDVIDNKQSLVIAVYCISFSLIMQCHYWRSATIESINEHAHLFYQTMTDNDFDELNLPKQIKIMDANIIVQAYVKLLWVYISYL